ncbi:MAG: diguanylate cyclase [Magnetococcales bacterium]|nr:diguanylate cyclase [Magnetococcales bacterium]
MTILIAGLGGIIMQRALALERHQTRLHQMNEALLEARRHEKNYLLRGDASYQQFVALWLSTLEELAHQGMAQFKDDPVMAARLEDIIGLKKSYSEQFQDVLSHPRENQSVVNAARNLHRALDELLHDERNRVETAYQGFEMMFVAMMLAATVSYVLLVPLVMYSITHSLKIGIRFVREVAEGRLNTPMESFSDDEIGYLLTSLRDMAAALRDKEEENLRGQMSRLALSGLLETSLEPLSQAEQLRVALQIIFTIPWLRVRTGAIFLTEEETGDLRLVASEGLLPSVRELCDRVASGHCLCGAALKEKHLIVAPPGDHRHTVQYEGMSPHGHYCAPILSRGQVLGVVNLYLHEAHAPDSEEVALLTAVTNTLAGIIERKRMEQKLNHLAHHDVLTNLPNRMLFHEHLDQALALAARHQNKMAVMLIDLDRFKQVNDTLGHAAGDELLVETSQRIKGCLRASDTVARMGGDEFAVILMDIEHSGAGGVAGKIIKSLTAPFLIQGQTCHIGASIGIALYPDHGTRDSLLARADEAMYQVKKGGRNDYRYYDTPEDAPVSL